MLLVVSDDKGQGECCLLCQMMKARGGGVVSHDLTT